MTKSGERYEHYYKSLEEKSAALRDDRYVYPGDPVGAEHVRKAGAGVISFAENPCKYRPRLPKRLDLRHPQANILQRS